jgi:hypothetical protein
MSESLFRIILWACALLATSQVACGRRCLSGRTLQNGVCVAMGTDAQSGMSDAAVEHAPNADAAASRTDEDDSSMSTAGAGMGGAPATGASNQDMSQPSTPASMSTMSVSTAGSGAGMLGSSGTGSSSNLPGSNQMPICGNGQVEAGERCDGQCPTSASCVASAMCFRSAVSGDAANCTALCEQVAITECAANDGCCPDGCNANTDSDCSASCGNGTLEEGETCDPQSSCETSCNDDNVCTKDQMSGSVAQCNVACLNSPITSPMSGDGCCPEGANAKNDNDCEPKCGNGVTEPGETCDGNCMPSCDDRDACTMDVVEGDESTCDLSCGAHLAIGTSGAQKDGCCPRGASLAMDADCPAPSGWTAVTKDGCVIGGTVLRVGPSYTCGDCTCSPPPTASCRGSVRINQNTQSEPKSVTASSCQSGSFAGRGSPDIDVYVSLSFEAITSQGSSGQGCVPMGGELRTSWDSTATFCPARDVSTSSCLMRSGDQSCPTGYAKTTWYTDIAAGTASCKCVGCGVESGGGCERYAFSQSGCGGAIQYKSAGSSADRGMLSTTSVWFESEARCAADARLETSPGTVKGANPYTVCCP